MQQPVASDTPAGLPDQAELEDLVTRMLAAARAEGADAAEAGASVDSGLSVTVRLGEVETLEHHRDRALGLTVYVGGRKGSASTADFRPQAVEETARAACAIARHTTEDPAAGLADPARLATAVPELDLSHPWALSPDGAIELARTCEAAGRVDGIRNSEGASVSTHQGVRVYGNSAGFLGGYPSTRHSLSCVLLAGADGAMQRDYWYTVARDAADLEAAEAVGRRAAERTLRRCDARRLSTRQVPVLFAAEVAGGLIGHLVSAVRGPALYRQASFLLDRLGQPVFADFVRIHEQPHLAKALGSAPFDNEGVATAARDLVRDGVLQGYVLDSYAARRLGMETTGNAGGVHNLTVAPGPMDAAALLREMGTGLLVTELMGQGVNTVTGDYSRGASGFWVENGEIAYPVEEITIAGNLGDMYRNLVAAGSDVDTRGNIRSGSLLVAEMTVAGE